MNNIVVKTTQENDTFYIKRYNTSRRIDVQLTRGGDVIVVSKDSLPSVTFNLHNQGGTVDNVISVPGFLSDIYGTASLRITDEAYKELVPGTYYTTVVGRVSDGSLLPFAGNFYIKIIGSQLE